jgi:hypothetical protein
MMQKDGIVVTGDLAVDWFELTVPPPVCPAGAASGQRTVPADPSANDSLAVNWQGFMQVVRFASPGGALMLADYVRAALKGAVPVIGPQVKGALESIPASEIIHSYVTLKQASVKDPWYLAESRGYMGPNDGIPGSLHPASQLVTWPTIEGTPRLVVIDDGGNGFRRAPGLFPSCPPESVVIYKLHRPLARGELWTRLAGTPGDGRDENLVVVVNVNDLRMAPEVNISSGLSWERTARELLNQIRLNPHLEHLGRCRNLLVVLDTDAVFVYHCAPRPLARLVFDPKLWEGGFRAESRRGVVGLTNAFTAALAAHIYRSEGRLEGLHEAATAGLIATRRLLLAGYRNAQKHMSLPIDKVFDFSDRSIVPEKLAYDSFASAVIPLSSSLLEPDPDYWRILDARTRNTRMRVAENLVRTGQHPIMEEVPELQVGGLATSDRSEIESFSAVRKLLGEYLKGKDEQPLSIAVFGAPGSGKSFGVKQIAQSMGISRDAIGTINLSQLGPAEGLNSAFHRIRDIGLSNRLPLFFFDEFDCRDLEWLKLFLAPMQDGEFEDRGVNYRLGRCILVFAGGTSATFEDFAARQQICRAQKLPDFISRLRGFINIRGPNPRTETDADAARSCREASASENGQTLNAPTAANPVVTDSPEPTHAETVVRALKSELEDPGYVIRRAKLWRSLMERSTQAQDLFHGKELNIDPGLLRALLRVPRYKHGVRSMAAILQMSRLNGKKRFDKSDLPPREQLALHVDVEDFFFLLERERFTNHKNDEAKIVEHLAKASHGRYVRARKARNQPLKVPVDFDALDPEKKASNRDLAADIPQKLRAIGQWFRPVTAGEHARSPMITEDEIEQLSIREHQRWEREQRYQGVASHKCFGPFERLPPDVQDYDREIVLSVPCLLGELGLEVVREEDSDGFHEIEVVEVLAREIHNRYVKEQKKKGETAVKNPALAAFEKLPADIQRSNRDNASHIPTKLKAIGYGMRRLPPGGRPMIRKLEAGEIETMARMEHERWVWERLMSGWIYAPGAKVFEKKTSPHMVPYDQLTDDIKEYDRETVRLIPELLASIGYEVYRGRSLE